MDNPQNPYQNPATPVNLAKAPDPDAPQKPGTDLPSAVPAAPTTPAYPGSPVKPTPAHLRNGKVARLPKAFRDQINQMISDGFTYGEIIQELGEAGSGLSEGNVGNWKAGGYQDWLKEQQRLDGMRVRQEFAIDLVRSNDGAQTHQAVSQIAALNLCDLLDDFHPARLKQVLETDPATYTMLLNAYTRLLMVLPKLSEAELNCERRRAEAAERKAKCEKEKGSQKPPGLSEEARR